MSNINRMTFFYTTCWDLTFMNLILGSFQMFRNPIAHTPRVKWQRDLDDAVDCLTLISFLHFVLDECHPIPTNRQE